MKPLWQRSVWEAKREDPGHPQWTRRLRRTGGGGKEMARRSQREQKRVLQSLEILLSP